jgi:mannose-6-phosphate isomerase class I
MVVGGLPGGMKSNYDKFPVVAVPGAAGECVAGWDGCTERLRQAITQRSARRTVLLIDCYPGVNETELLERLAISLSAKLVLRASEAMLSHSTIESLVAPFLRENEPVFGFLADLTLEKFFDSEKIQALKRQVAQTTEGLILIVGCGARLLADGDILVYADLARWEIQQRFRRNEIGNLGVPNRLEPASIKYRRAFFVDWRVADRWKRDLIGACDFMLDTNQPSQPKLASGKAVRSGLRHAVTRPFRVVPFFDPAPWGGQWMKQKFDLDPSNPNYGWCFDCVPEENSLLLGFDNIHFETPALNLVFDQPLGLLGAAVYARFGAEFPIRFDLLDTMGGGNLSFQVHPLAEYIQKHFGMPYTQDESYYLLDAGSNAKVYLGLGSGIDSPSMLRDLKAAQNGQCPFPVEKYAQSWPAKKHDHYLIPAGTVHCSGANSMVLEISATPYIFTFKMWDWGRMGLDGHPRPIHLQHGIDNINWERTPLWVKRNLINHIRPLASGEGWREEATGLQEGHFIETRRHWFDRKVTHDTKGTVNVLNLVQGDEAVVESPDNAFAPFTVHYAETFIVPAQVGPYSIRPQHESATSNYATMKAFVR